MPYVHNSTNKCIHYILPKIPQYDLHGFLVSPVRKGSIVNRHCEYTLSEHMAPSPFTKLSLLTNAPGVRLLSCLLNMLRHTCALDYIAGVVLSELLHRRTRLSRSKILLVRFTVRRFQTFSCIIATFLLKRRLPLAPIRNGRVGTERRRRENGPPPGLREHSSNTARTETRPTASR